MRPLGWLAALVLAARPIAILAVTPHVALAPTTVTLTIRIEPNAENRRLIVEADSGTAYRRSDLPLEGHRAAVIHIVTWRGMEEGDYAVIASIVSQASELLGQDRSRFLVVGKEEGP